MDENNNTSDNPVTDTAPDNGAPKPTAEPAAKEVSAATIGRMMGLATVSDLKLLDSKVDLLSTRVSGLTLKLDKILSMLGSAPTGSDLERIDIHVGSIKTMLRESMQSIEEAMAKKS